MKRAVWQKEGVYQNSFFSCTARDNCHGYLKTDAGTLQAPAEFYGGVVRHDPRGTRTGQLPEFSALRGVLRTHLRAAFCATLSLVDVPRASAARLRADGASIDARAGCLLHSQERQGDLGLGALL
jgi:hypothetical protein